jgi:hypothetical protein
MHFFNKIIFLLLFIIFFSCKTRLERQGWQRTAVVSQLDTSTINKKDKELIVVRFPDNIDTDSLGKIINKPFLAKDKSPVYVFNVFVKDSGDKIISEPFPFTTPASPKSDLAYYKWESDSVCLVKILYHGNLQASYELSYFHNPFSKRLRPIYIK